MASSKMVDVKNVVSNNNIYRDKNNFLSLSLYGVHCTSYDEYIHCVLFSDQVFFGVGQVEKGFLGL